MRTQRHAHRYVGVLNHLRKLFEADFSVAIQVRFHDGLVHDLLQLLIFQITAHHHLEYNEQLAIGYVAITINVVNFEREAQLLLLVAFATECAEPRNKLLKVDITSAVLVENSNHARRERVARDLWEGEEFLGKECQALFRL